MREHTPDECGWPVESRTPRAPVADRETRWRLPLRGDEKSSYIFDADDRMVAEIRGWGYLTGQGGLRLSDDDAIAVQTARIRAIVDAVNHAAAQQAAPVPVIQMPPIEVGDWVLIDAHDEDYEIARVGAALLAWWEKFPSVFDHITEIRKADGRRFLRQDGQWQEVPRDVP